MNSLLLRNLGIPRTSSLQTFSEYREAEANSTGQSVTVDGALLEFQTLELRVHPPNVEVDNETYDDRTVVTVDSANRPGTLVECVQTLTELGLNVCRARISSDGGWFHDEFHVMDQPGQKVVNESKLKVISKMLSVDAADADAGEGPEGSCTVFELSGTDRPGLMSHCMDKLATNGCDVRSAAVWTDNGRVAFVFAVVERDSGLPLRDKAKMASLRGLLLGVLDPTFARPGNNQPPAALASVQTVRGAVHYERRLHLLMLKEEEKDWQRNATAKIAALAAAQAALPAPSPSPPLPDFEPPIEPAEISGTTVTADGMFQLDAAGSMEVCRADTASPPVQQPAGASRSSSGSDLPALARLYLPPKADKPEVTIKHYGHLNYWLVTIRCKDRQKLFFDTVCTLADLNYDIYHATIDSEGSLATQLYYIRPRFGDFTWDAAKLAKLQYMLETSIQRRIPKGCKLNVQSIDHSCLAELTARLHAAGLSISRAKVKVHGQAGHTFYLIDASGNRPDKARVLAACQASGGRGGISTAGTSPGSVGLPSELGVKFNFTFLESSWSGSPNMAGSA